MEELAENIIILLLSATAAYSLFSKVLNDCEYLGIELGKGNYCSIFRCVTNRRVEIRNHVLYGERFGPQEQVELVDSSVN